ncbi:MAG: DUF86 domain-containing protein [Candidatus Hydrogenedentota bacterium]
MPHEPEKYLFDMLDSARFLQELSKGRTLDELRNDRAFRSAVERELQIIGEAAIMLEKVAPDLVSRITEHARIVRFRHILVHGYDKIDRDILWNVLQSKLVIMTSDIDRLLKQLDKSS